MAGRRQPPINPRKPRVSLYDEQQERRRARVPRGYYEDPRYERLPRNPAPRRRRPASAPPAQPRYVASRRKPKRPPRGVMTFSTTAVIALFFAFVIIYMGRGAHEFFTPDIGFTTLRLSNMEMHQSVPGMIIRYETVFQTDRDGRVGFEINEFDRVREGVAVARVRDIEAVAQNDEDMSRLQQETRHLHDRLPPTSSDPIIDRVNSNLKNRVSRSIHHNAQSNLSEIYALLDNVSSITDNRNRMILNESVNARNDLSRQYDFLSAQRALYSNDIYATTSGIMSQIIDGFEGREGFTPSTMRSISREQVRMSIDHDAIIPGREVAAGDDIFKIVENTWYVATWMPMEMAHGFMVGTERHIYLENATSGRFERMPMRIEHIDQTHGREALVIFRSSRNVIEFLNQRNVNIRVTDNIQNGFMVPSTAIVTRRYFRIPLTHIHGVENYTIMHRHDYGIQSIPVYIHDRTPTHAYVLEDTLPFLGEELVSIIPVDITDLQHFIADSDIRIVHGVYRTTLGHAEFREVYTGGEILEAGGVVMLDPAQNPNIRQFDSIVTDASMVRQGQVVR
ncbi:MAG: hypothetical protein FWF81_06865 [Defluviitaleaceae bacterium]|nr:hypothetical protein [Defluviitaleaceae bacterium]